MAITCPVDLDTRRLRDEILTPDKSVAYGEVLRVLKPGGRFLPADIIAGNERRSIDVEKLRARGRRARRLAEGLPEWRGAGLPIETSA